jgi:D-amino-acid oxidase
MDTNAVLVIGAGVSGLTCALSLKQRDFKVTVIAENFAPRVTSVVAGALWEWPPAVCGLHKDQISLMRSKVWSLDSYGHFTRLAQDSSTGVFLRTVTFYFTRPVNESPQQLLKMTELAGHVAQFVHDSSLIAANRVNPEFGMRDAYSHIAPMIDTDVYMSWLMERVNKAGCRVVCRQISGNLRVQEASLRREFAVDAIVNCAGMGARELAADEMYPLRGAVIRVLNDGRAMPRITQAHCVSHDETSTEPNFIFIVPRGHDRLVLGGLAEPDEWDLGIGFDNYDPIRRMYRRCIEFLPSLKTAEIDAAEPVRVGLRPYRKQQVRLEREPDTRIVHNYGHGGSGVTLSWGCAREVVAEVERMLGGGRQD